MELQSPRVRFYYNARCGIANLDLFEAPMRELERIGRALRLRIASGFVCFQEPLQDRIAGLTGDFS